MPRLIRAALPITLLATACSGGGDGPSGASGAPPVVVESAELTTDGRFCRVQGTLSNRTPGATYEVTLNFEVHDSVGRALAETTQVIADVGPLARVSFRTDPFIGPLGNMVPCSQVAELHQHGSDARCTGGTGPGC
jgi:hypothetical protein